MPSSLSDIEQLRREAAELRAERRSQRSDSPAEEPTASDVDRPEWEESLQELTALLEGAAQDIEEAARQHPALALLAALAAGIVIGQLLSRR